VHLAGSTVKLVACAVALLIAAGDTQLVNWPTFIKFISMLAVVAVAAPGVPGGAVMASLAITESILGFGKEQTALYITLYIATDSFGTACNVTGDGAISLIVNRIFPKREG
jgi:Na+/H+-dicarboxylate symporter